MNDCMGGWWGGQWMHNRVSEGGVGVMVTELYILSLDASRDGDKRAAF